MSLALQCAFGCATQSPGAAVAVVRLFGHGLSRGPIESTNTKVRLLARIAFGFCSADALIALAMLALGGHRLSLPGRTKNPRISQ
jgi:hypothetical protein